MNKRNITKLLSLLLSLALVLSLAANAFAATTYTVWFYHQGVPVYHIEKEEGSTITDADIAEAPSYEGRAWSISGNSNVSPVGHVVTGTVSIFSRLLPHSHSYTEEITTPATCTVEGLATYTCTCGESYTEVISALGHTEGNAVRENVVDADCTTAGSYEEAKYCSTCNTELLRESKTIEALGHSWNDATCTAPKTCSICGAEEGDELGHKVETIPAVAATCKSTGLTEGTRCSVCKADIVEQEEIPMLAHTVQILPAVAPSCTKDGLTEGSNCSVCGDVIVAQEVASKTGHTNKVVSSVAPTCTATGLSDGVVCSVCGEILKAQTVVSATGHSNEVIPAVDATCTEAGKTEGEKCSVCGTIITAQTDTSALGHREEIVAGKAATCTETGLTDGKKCSVCGITTVEQEEIPANGHTEVIDNAVAATCETTGLTEGKHCSKCDEVLVAQEEVNALGHNTQAEGYVAPTCTTAGSTGIGKCTVCGTELAAAEVIPALGHTEEIDAAVAATCTETGLTEGKHCSVCNEVLVKQEETPALGHAYDSGKVTQDPTCDAEGVKLFTCQNDKSHTYTQAVAKLNTHVDTDNNGKCDICGGRIATYVRYYGTSDNPKTDDPSNVPLWIMLLAVGLCGMGGSVLLRKRRA